MSSDAPEQPPARSAETAGGKRVLVINWTPDDIGLLRALTRLGDGVRMLCIGPQGPDDVDAALAEETERPTFEYRRGEVDNQSIDRFARYLEDEVNVRDAFAVVVLPHRGRSEPDAFSRLACAAIKRACGDDGVPNIVVAVDDPEAAFEFAGHGVATIFYQGFLRSALMAHACVDLAVFQFLLELIERRKRIALLPIPDDLRGGTFLDACVEIDRDERGAPVTVLGVFRSAGPGRRKPRMLINPGPKSSLKGALGLVALTEAVAL